MRKGLYLGMVATFAVIMMVVIGVAHPATAQGPFLVGVNATTNVYDVPNLNGNVVGQLQAGQTWFVFGTDTTHNWTEVQITTSIFGWVPSSALGTVGLNLPVLSGFTGGPIAGNAAGNTKITAVAPTRTAIPTTSANANNSASSGNSNSSAATPVSVPYLAYVANTTNAYGIPDLNASSIGQLLGGQTWYLLGRDTTGNWVEVQITTSIFAWAPASAFSLTGVNLPVLSAFTGGAITRTTTVGTFAAPTNVAPTTVAPTTNATTAPTRTTAPTVAATTTTSASTAVPTVSAPSNAS